MYLFYENTTYIYFNENWLNITSSLIYLPDHPELYFWDKLTRRVVRPNGIGKKRLLLEKSGDKEYCLESIADEYPKMIVNIVVPKA